MHNPQNQMAKAFQLHQAGKLKKAGQCYKSVLKSNPRHPDALMLLGIVHYENNEFFKAVKTLEKAVAAKPEGAAAHFNLGLALQALGKREEAGQAYNRALMIDPTHKDAAYCLGVVLIQNGAIQAGRTHLEKLLSAMPDNPGLFGWLGTAMQMQGDFRDATQTFNRALKLDPDNLEALMGLSTMPSTLVRPQPAFSYAEKAAAIAPDNANALASYARWLEVRRRLDDAKAYAKRAIKASPNNYIAHLAMARIELALGKPQAACERGQKLLARTDLPLDAKRDTHAVVGTALDKLGEYGGAFLAFEMKNDCVQSLPETKKIDHGHTPRLIERTRAWLAAGGAGALEQHQTESAKAPVPIFFIGFPRSGTTLMEQVLGSHPSLQTSGELPALEITLNAINDIAQREIDYPKDLAVLLPEHLAALRQVYWKQFEHELKASPSERVLVDKNPYNTLYLPFIHVLFPTAKVIMALRDPRDVCLSNFMQTFESNKAMVQMKDMASTARFYTDFMALWREGRDKLALNWLEYRYEDLINDFDVTVARVLDFLELPWDDAVHNFQQTAKNANISTPSYTGVTNKLSRKAIGRWKNYEKQMQRVLDILKTNIIELGYGDD